MSNERKTKRHTIANDEADFDVDSDTAALPASPSDSHAKGFDNNRTQVDVDIGRINKSTHERHSDDSTCDEENHSNADTQHLLAHETLKLHEHPAVAATQPDDVELPPPSVTKASPVTWSSLPKKSQLAILTISRLSEPLTQTSLAAYMFYQLKSFKLPSGEAPSDGTVATQVGFLAAAFTGAQFMTAIAWGRAADSAYLGRKKVILIGLLGTAIGSLGFGFSTNFTQAVFWRCAGGVLNGNIGVMRTMISEMIKEKKFQSRAFLLLPMTFNIGVIIGPLLGGLLADPVGTYPQIFGPGSSLGGNDGVWWLTRYPYALPNVVSACFLIMSSTAVYFGLEETLEALRDKPDIGLRLSRWIGRVVFRRRQEVEYSALSDNPFMADDLEMEEGSRPKIDKVKPRRRLPLRRIWTPRLLLTLLAHGLLASHVGTFTSLWFVFLSTPRYDPDVHTHATNITSSFDLPPDYHPHPPFTFTGGLALPPPSIGTALAIIGVIGITMQLLLYPWVSFRLGTIASYRLSLLLFPLSYFLTPFLAIVPSTAKPPHQASGPMVWLAITLVLIVQTTARTFALPATAILVNNSSPHPSVLGTVHGIAQSVSSATRTIGPVLAGWLYSLGLAHGVIGLAWWCICGTAIIGAVAGRWVKDGDGHDIWLEGEKEELEANSKT